MNRYSVLAHSVLHFRSGDYRASSKRGKGLSVFTCYLHCLVALFFSGAAQGEVLEAPEVVIRARRPVEAKPAESRESGGRRLNVAPLSSPAGVLEGAGLLGTREGSRTTQFSLRGLDAYETRYFLDNVPLQSPVFNTANFSNVPSEMVSAVDLYAQSVPAFLAADGISGAIHFRTEGIENPFLAASGGSYATWRGSARVRGPVSIGIEAFTSDDNYPYLDHNGTLFDISDDIWRERANGDVRRVALYPQLRIAVSDTQRWRLWGLFSHQQGALPSPAVQPLGVLRTSQWGLLAASFEGARSPFEATSYMQVHRSSLSGNTWKLENAMTHTEEWNAGVWGRMRWGSVLDPSTSLRIEYSRCAASSVPSQRWSGVVAGALDATVGPSRWTPSLIGTLYADGTERARGMLSPRLAVEVPIFSGVHLALRGGTHFRVPALSEKYGVAGSVTPNPELIPESAQRAEMEISAQAEVKPIVMQGRMAAFWIDARDLIAYLQSGPSTVRAHNMDRAEIRGLELGMTALLPSVARVNVNGLLTDATNRGAIPAEHGKKIPNRPEWSLSMEATLEPRPVKLSYLARLVGRQFGDPLNLKEIPFFTDHTAILALSTTSWGTFQLEVHNLFDTVTSAYSLAGLTLSEPLGGVDSPAPGRRLLVSWRTDL